MGDREIPDGVRFFSTQAARTVAIEPASCARELDTLDDQSKLRGLNGHGR